MERADLGKMLCLVIVIRKKTSPPLCLEIFFFMSSVQKKESGDVNPKILGHIV